MPEVVEWIDADGGTTVLDVEWDVDGRGMPPIKFEEDTVPLQSGSRLRFVRHEVRDVRFAVWITADTPTGLRARLRSLIARLDPVRGDGRIRVTTDVNDQREIVCRYASGLELAEKLGGTSGPTLQRAPVTFRAVLPYWADVSDTTVTYTTGVRSSFFPFFPLRLTASEVFATGSVINGGDVATWPVWTISGPGSAIVLRNQTSKKSLTLSTSLGAGESMVIDTREGRKTVTKHDGANRFSDLSATSSLWSLTRGVNALQIEMSNASTTSAVTLAYRPRYVMV